MSDEAKAVGIKIVPGSSEQAPFIYFDGVSTMGTNNGAILIELIANVLMPEGTGVRTDLLTTAHLRCTPSAATELRRAIDKALDMLKLPPGSVPDLVKRN